MSKNSKLFLNLRLRNSNRTMPLDFVRNRRKTFPVKSPWKRNIINFLTEILIILPFTLYHQGSCSIFLRHNESGFEEAKVEFFRTWKFSWIFVLLQFCLLSAEWAVFELLTAEGQSWWDSSADFTDIKALSGKKNSHNISIF